MTPNSTQTLGILGGGQLGRMLALAAAPLGVRTLCYDPSEDACAGHVTELISAEWHDEAALRGFAERCDVITYEFENVPLAAARLAASIRPLRPGVRSLEVAQDRLRERDLFRMLEIAAPDHLNIESDEDARAAKARPYPAILKARRLGYDGKGQTAVHAPADLDAAWASLGRVPTLLDQMIDFRREVSVILVRTSAGLCRAWPVAENAHDSGILVRSIAPALIDDRLAAAATAAATRIAQDLDHVGVLAVEFFEVDALSGSNSGTQLLANEIAPRVHNTGHWTIDYARTSQFENHVRAVLDLPLGPTETRPGVTPAAPVEMRNLIADHPGLADLLAHTPAAKVHLYGKSPRPGRKLGHVTTQREPLAPG